MCTPMDPSGALSLSVGRGHTSSGSGPEFNTASQMLVYLDTTALKISLFQTKPTDESLNSLINSVETLVNELKKWDYKNRLIASSEVAEIGKELASIKSSALEVDKSDRPDSPGSF